MATYYCDWANGNDANAGTSEGSGNAWKSIDKAESVVAAGDTVWVKATGTYTNDGHTRVLTMTASGSAGNFIKFIGYTTTTGDGGQCTWSGASADTQVIYGTTHYRWFENIIFTSATGVNVSTWTTCASHVYANCRTTSAGSHGQLGCGTDGVAIDCVGDNCDSASWGIAIGGGAMLGCVAYDQGLGLTVTCNLGTGTGESGSGLMFGNVVYGATTRSMMLREAGTDLAFGGVVAHNTVDGENVADWACSTGGNHCGIAILNNVFYDCDTGLDDHAGTADVSRGSAHFQNVLNSNTTNYGTNYDDFDVSGNDLTGAPTFVDEAGHDYTPASDSSAYGTAMDLEGIDSGRDIGAIPAPIRGVRRPTAMTGGMG